MAYEHKNERTVVTNRICKQALRTGLPPMIFEPTFFDKILRLAKAGHRFFDDLGPSAPLAAPRQHPEGMQTLTFGKSPEGKRLPSTHWKLKKKNRFIFF